MKLLIDADVISYRAAFAAEHTKYIVTSDGGFSLFDDAKSAKEEAVRTFGVVWSRKELQPEDTALMIADTLVRDILARYEAKAELFLTGIGNFRTSIATRATYKGNRSGTPTHLKAVRKHLITSWNAEVSQGEEADDLLGIAMTTYPDSVCCSVDKDLMQLPGKHFDFVKKEEVTVSRREADLNFYCQVLSGDSTDNIPGVTGIGPVKARKLLADAKSGAACWHRIIEVYKNVYGPDLGYGYAVEAAQLVFVRRTPGQIWSPPDRSTHEAPQTQTQPNAA
jgi:hypothetical protein